MQFLSLKQHFKWQKLHFERYFVITNFEWYLAFLMTNTIQNTVFAVKNVCFAISQTAYLFLYFNSRNTKFCIRKQLPPILALYATPTLHIPLFSSAATSPAQRVPCLQKRKSHFIAFRRFQVRNKRGLLSFFYHCPSLDIFGGRLLQQVLLGELRKKKIIGKHTRRSKRNWPLINFRLMLNN